MRPALLLPFALLRACVDRLDLESRSSLPVPQFEHPSGVASDCVGQKRAGWNQDGPYWIDPDGDGGAEPFLAWCDMTTAGGGWTLVYSYTFTTYSSFGSSANAVTPRPSWPFPGTVPVSTTPPSSPASLGALDFPRWRELEGQFLVTSSINHWVVCSEGAGSLARAVPGTITCSLERLVGTACTTVVPTAVSSFGDYGAALNASSHFYYWDGEETTNYPTHDPCGTNAANHLTGVADPRGAVYLRREPP